MIDKLNTAAEIKVLSFATYKRDLNNYTNVIFTVKVFVGNGIAKVECDREIVICGFKLLVAELDLKQSQLITLPVNAVNYKGKLEPVIFKEVGLNTYNKSVEKFSFEQLKHKLMYELRFWMYQMFSDNFSELDYWIKGGKNPGNYLTAIIEGIILNNVNNLVCWCQQIGNINPQIYNLKTVQRIKIKINLIESQKWMPSGADDYFEHLDELVSFSFAKGCANIDVSTNDKKIYSTGLPRVSINVSIDRKTTISQSRWNSFYSVMFTIGVTRIKRV